MKTDTKMVSKLLLVFSVLLIAVALTACAGKAGSDGSNGQDGATGASGKDGQNGQNGQNGQDGAPGQDAPVVPPNPNEIDSLVMPCAADPMNPDINDLANNGLEVLIRLKSNQLLSSYTESGRTYFRVLPQGIYASTGAIYCAFTVHIGGIVTKN